LFATLYRVQSTRRQDTARILSSKASAIAHKEFAALRKEMGKLSPPDMLGRIAATTERYISRKFKFAATGKTLEELKDELIRRGIRPEVVESLAGFIETMDRYRFGGAGVDNTAKGDMLSKSEEFIVQLEKSARKERS
jgi:hypothetical protein